MPTMIPLLRTARPDCAQVAVVKLSQSNVLANDTILNASGQRNDSPPTIL